jgi:hypothetical protein
VTTLLRRGWLVLPLLALACGGGGGPGGLDIVYVTDQGPGDVAPEAVQDDGDRDPGVRDNNVVQGWYEIILLHDTTVYQDVGEGGAFRINAKVLDYGQMSPAIGVYVDYEIAEITDLDGNPVADADGALTGEQVPTDGTGFVQNIFRANSRTDVIYRVVLSLPYEDAEEKDILIRVLSSPCGCATVKLSYDGALDPSALHDIEVSVLPTDFTCDIMRPESPIPDAVLQQRTIANVYGQQSFECLPSESYMTLFARAKGPKVMVDGKPVECFVASGCDEGVFLRPDTGCKDVTLKVYQANMDPSGRYDCVDHFDFTNLVKQCAGGDTTIMDCVTTGSSGDLGKTVCCVLAEMIKFFKTPGYTIIESIADLAKIWLGSIIVDTVINLFKDAVAKIITDWLLNNSPDWVKDFFTVGDDMLGAITNLEMLSDLVVMKLNNDLTVQGTQYWTGVALYWKFGCDPSDPGYEECGRNELNMENIGDPNFPLDILEGKFTANVADWNRLIVNQHAVKLNYGKLVLYVINELVVATITGGQAHSLKEAAQLWINCKAISNGILGEIASWFGGTRQQIEDVCKGSVDFLFGFVDVFLGALTLDTEMSLSGTGTLIDETCDLKVDRITNGKYLGYVQGNAQQASITGTFEAVKQK